ncbi:hypothetical protein BH11PAT1_BH11PAT1_4850 [soil metagenome]
MTTRKNWEIPDCNYCGSKKYHILYKNLTYWEYPGRFQIVQCTRCQLVFTSPRPIPSEIGKYYIQENYFGTQDAGKKNDLTDSITMFSPMYARIDTEKKPGKILDIGAGTGSFLYYYKQKGWKVDGVELMKTAVTYAKKHYGITLRNGDFFDFSFTKKSIDVVSLNGALEHVYNPLQTLQRIESLLKDDGLLIFSVPNYASVGRILFGRNWFPWQPPRHLYHYSPKVIKKMLRKAGFTNISITYNYWLQNYYILFQSLRYTASPTFKKTSMGGLVTPFDQRKKTFSLKKYLGKIAGETFARILAFIEPFIKKGEVMIVYAKKN